MKLNFEVPINYMDTFYRYQDFLVCNVFTCIESSDYYNFFKAKAKDKYIILDTTTYNLNKHVSLSDLLEIAKYINAKEIVAPYFFFNVNRTLDQLSMLYRYMDEKNVLSNFNILVMPQGNNMNEFLNALPKFTKFPSESIGISTNVFSLDNTYRTEQLRFNLIQKMSKLRLLGKKNIHLMDICGIQFLKAYKKGQRLFKIRSLHTSYPTTLGILGKTFYDTKKKPEIPNNFYSMNLQKETIERIKQNMSFMREYK